MFTVPLPQIGTDLVWRDAAKRLIGAGIPPHEVLWDYAGQLAPVLDGTAPLPNSTRRVHAPASFLKLLQLAIWHQADDRFSQAYALLWRLRNDRNLMQDDNDTEVAKLQTYADEVARAQRHMRKRICFHDLRQSGSRHSFAAWYAPSHHVVEPTAPWFATRLPNLDWMIATPDVTAQFIDGNLSFQPGQPKPDWPKNKTRINRYLGDLFNPSGEVQISKA